MDARRRPMMQLASALLLVAQLADAAPAWGATAPAKVTATRPAGLVSRAQRLYREARYDEAVGLLVGPTLRKDLAGDELREARIVLARCYVKKGMLPRGREYFGAILADDPSFVLDASHADAEELAVFGEVKAALPPAAGQGSGAPPATPATPAAPNQGTVSQPRLHKPAVGSSSESKPGWLSRNRYLAIAVVAGGGIAAGLAMGGGGGGGSTPVGPGALPGFPAPPGGH